MSNSSRERVLKVYPRAWCDSLDGRYFVIRLPYAAITEIHNSEAEAWDEVASKLSSPAGETPSERERDDCEVCHGAKGGVKGNENIVDGVVMCDYCHVESVPEPVPTGGDDAQDYALEKLNRLVGYDSAWAHRSAPEAAAAEMLPLTCTRCNRDIGPLYPVGADCAGWMCELCRAELDNLREVATPIAPAAVSETEKDANETDWEYAARLYSTKVTEEMNAGFGCDQAEHMVSVRLQMELLKRVSSQTASAEPGRSWGRPPAGSREDIIGQRELPDGRTEYLMHNEALCNPYYLAVSAPGAASAEGDGWIAVTPETMPRTGAECLVVYDGVVQRIAYQRMGLGFACADGYVWQPADEIVCDPIHDRDVTHWRPLPAPPVNEETK